jgi:hypothetical protein
MSIIKPQPFCYAEVQVTALGAGLSATPNFSVANDEDFMLTEIRGYYNKIAVFTTGGILVQFQLQNGELWSNVAIQGLSFMSGNQIPATGIPIKFDTPIRIPASSQIQVNITNADAAIIAAIQIQFWGYKQPKAY